MAKVTPATIRFTVEGKAETVIRFHAVISETHNAVSEVTKFPVQTGFEVSNHKIRRNRRVAIEGVISNNILEGTTSDFHYSDMNNAKAVFKALESLVNNGITCKVTTNLGEYDPVLFTKFSTKQGAGMVDSMKFSISGEEVQVSSVTANSIPKVLSFKPLSEERAKIRAAELKNAGIHVDPETPMSEAKVTPGESFVVTGEDELGLPTETAYEFIGKDPTTLESIYAIVTSQVELYTAKAIDLLPDGGLLGNIKRFGGIPQISACLANEALELAEEAATDYIDTAMGKLVKKSRGGMYDTIMMSINETGQAMIHSGIGCMVRGITGKVSEVPYLPGESLPSTHEILDGAIAVGKSRIYTPPTDQVTLTQIHCGKDKV